MKPGTARAFALRRRAHTRAPGPESLSLGSLGVARALPSEFNMKLTTLVAVLALGSACSAFAQSQYERELNQLNQERDKALLTATEPVYRRYRVSLEQLLRKATQANDLDAAVKIKAQFSAIPATAQLGKPKPKTADELKDFLHGTTWNIANGSPDAKPSYTYTFSKSGTVKHSNGQTGPLSFTGPRSLKIWNYDPAEFNEDFTGFRAQGAHTVYFGTLKP